MLPELKVGESYILWAKVSPVTSVLTRVKILHVWNFPATGKVFVTIEDLENKNTNFKGQEEKIISTVHYTHPTAFRPSDYCTDEELVNLRSKFN